MHCRPNCVPAMGSPDRRETMIQLERFQTCTDQLPNGIGRPALIGRRAGSSARTMLKASRSAISEHT
jgi:hypothetical protein